MTGRQQPPERVTPAFVAWVDTRLSGRDRNLMQAVSDLRLVTGRQLDTLCFLTLEGRSRAVVRGRVVGRLVAWRVLKLIDRRVGGTTAGSSSAIYGLDSVGEALTTAKATKLAANPGERFRAHTLAISQLCADLVLLTHDDPTIRLHEFRAEPESWWPDGLGGLLKPDAYIQLRTPTISLGSWAEIDRSTESIPTLGRKLRSYLDFVERGQSGPHGVMPQVVITVIDDRRLQAVTELVSKLPPPANELFLVKRDDQAGQALLGLLRE